MQLRRSRLLLIAAFAAVGSLSLVFAACGDDDDAPAKSSSGGATATRASSNEGGGSSPASGKSSPTASKDNDDDGDSGDDGGNSSSSSSDLEKLAKDLTPPNSKETARYSTEDGLLVTFESNDSIDSLKNFYGSKIKSLSKVQGTLDTGDGTIWYFGDDDGNGVGGSVTVGKGDTNKSAVVLSLGKNGTDDDD